MQALNLRRTGLTLRRFLTDRFVIFALIGVGFFVWESLEEKQDSNTIVIGAGDVAMLQGRWQLQSGALPTDTELRALIDHHVREEVFVREALRLGLDEGDVIVRRRLAQKMELLVRDQYGEANATQADIEDYFAQHSERYVRPKQVGFRHIYLGGGPEPERDAVAAIRAQLTAGENGQSWRELGTAFMLAREFAPRPQTAHAELFGPDFARDLMEQTAPGDWLGPVRSAYGWHLVQIVAVKPRTSLSLDQVSERVASDLEAERFEAAVDSVFEEMAARYTVSQDWRAE